jgi:hypothetical protein
MLPHSNESTYASTRIAEPWALTQATTAPMLTFGGVTSPRGSTSTGA